MTERKKTLVFHQGALGDLILTFPALRELRKGCTVADGICQGKLGRLACDLHIFDRFFPLESAGFASLWSDSSPAEPRVLHLLDSYDQILIFSFSRNLEDNIKKMSKIPVFRVPPRPPVHQGIHVTHFIWDQLALQGVLPPNRALPEEKKYKCPTGSQKILIHPGSGSPRKNWPLNHFIQVYDILKSEGIEAEFILGPAEEFMAEDMQGLLVHCTPALSEIAEIMKNASAYLGNDSGLTHLAAFLGLPVTAIFGPSDPRRWKPLGNVRILRPSDLKCPPCFETERENCADSACLNRISADMAVCTIKEMLIGNSFLDSGSNRLTMSSLPGF
ncbi:MAG: glycosyltransferase family 9 protein [Desulfobacterales bacterium]